MNTQIIAIANQKGGVGKTTTCANLGIGLAQEGKKVLLIDGDPQGSLSISLGYSRPDTLPVTLSDMMSKVLTDSLIQPGEGILHHAEGVDLMPADIQLSGMEVSLVNAMSRETILRQYLDTVKRDYTHILIDCQPSLGMLTVNALAAANRVLIPVQAEYLPAKGLEQLLQTISKVRRQINPKLQIDGILLTMVDGRTNFAKEISALLRETYGSKIKVFGSEIPHSVRAKEISAEGKSIYAHNPEDKVAAAYKNLTKEVLKLESIAKNVKLASVDDLFTTEESRADASREKVVEIPLSELHPFKDHPFKVKDDEAMMETADSIRQCGVLVPAIARPDPNGGYELVAGHRRHHASEIAGKETMPVIVRDLDDDAATIIVVDSNLQREELLPSERAFSYKMKLEAMKHQGERKDLTSSQLGTKFRADELLAQKASTSRSQVQRFIRLTELIPPLLDMVDEKKIALSPAYELSFLKPEEQAQLVETMDYEQATPSLSQAQRMKKFSQEGRLTEDVMLSIMCEEKKSELDRVGKTIGELMEEMRIKAGAQNYKGHDYLDLARFDENTRHMIIFDVLTHDSPVGFKGDRMRLFLADAGYQKALENQERGNIKILSHARGIRGDLFYDRKDQVR